MKQTATLILISFQFLATALLAQGHNIPGSGFEAGAWIGAAYADDSGIFSHCVVFTGYGDERDRLVSFALTEQGNLILGLGAVPAAGTTKYVSAQVYIDDLPPVEILAEVDSERNTILAFPASDLVFEVFQAGWLMTIDVDGWRQTYKLRGTRKSLDALSDCALRYGLYEEQKPASSEGGGVLNPEVTQPEDAPPSSSGSGFIVSIDGHVLTNAHVVDDCSIFSINGKVANLVSVSQAFDLAILRANFDPGNPVAAFSPRSAKLNSDVTVLGYPYAGLLGGLNITRGAVSALTGLGGDETKMQITAPVQSGNSGGPVVASDGEVVGVVVSKLDAVKVASMLGDLPQNVNFAVRGEIAKLFLSQNGVEPVLGESDVALIPTNLAQRSAKFTVHVECR